MPLAWAERIGEISPEEWEDVLSRSLRPSPFLLPTFLLPWAETFAAGLPQRFARWAEGGKVGGFLFLYRRAGFGGWELLGGERVADSLDALVAAGSEGRFWAEVLRASREMLAEGPLSLPNLVEGSPALSLLPGICGELGIVFRLEETDRSPFLALPASFDRYLELLGKKERHELRRKLRRAAEGDPGLSYRVTGSPEELARDFPSFVELHRRSHREKNEFMDDRMAEFFRKVAQGFLSSGRLRLAFLRGSRGDIASAFQIEHNGVLHLYNSGFDPSCRGMTPGLALLARCIEDAIGRGLREYDFLRGGERYKYDLGGRDRTVYRATLSLP